LKTKVTFHDLALVGRILGGCSLTTKNGEYLRLAKINLPYEVSFSQEELTIN
jgi:hypothetical protein